MAVFVIRGMVGSSAKDGLKYVLSGVAKFLEILKTTGETTHNTKIPGKIEFIITRQSGAEMRELSDFVTEELFKELLNARKFVIRFDLKSGFKGWGTIWYEEKLNRKTSVNYEFAFEHPESLSGKLLGFLGVINIPKYTSLRSIIEAKARRVADLFEEVLSKFCGPTLYKSRQEFTFSKYEVDSIFLNIFGKLIKIREPD